MSSTRYYHILNQAEYKQTIDELINTEATNRYKSALDTLYEMHKTELSLFPTKINEFIKSHAITRPKKSPYGIPPKNKKKLPMHQTLDSCKLVITGDDKSGKTTMVSCVSFTIT
jgi:hypothetical protein